VKLFLTSENTLMQRKNTLPKGQLLFEEKLLENFFKLRIVVVFLFLSKVIFILTPKKSDIT
jgi:hypothetical protein